MRTDATPSISEPCSAIGSVINPVYVDHGELTACYPLTANYSREDRTKHPYNGIILTKDDTDHEYVIDSKDYGTYYQYHAAVAASGNDPAVPEHFTDEQVGGFLFGDGFGSASSRPGGGSSSGKPDEYWGVDVGDLPNHYSNSPALIEAPSILYAMTTVRSDSASFCSEEIWNKHRIYDYDTCSLCRNVTRSTATSTSYVATNTIVNEYAAIAYIPPLHWALIFGSIKVELNSSTFSPFTQTFTFSLQDTPQSFTGIGKAGTLPSFEYVIGEDTAKMYNFGFFAFNPDAANGKYVVCTRATAVSNLTYKIYKQIMIFKTPEYGGLDSVYDNYPVGWKPSMS